MQDQNRYLAPKFKKWSPYKYWIPTAPLDTRGPVKSFIFCFFRFGIAPRHRFNFNTRFYPLEEQLKDTSGSDDLVNETEAFLNNPLIYNFPPKSYHQVPTQKSPKIKSHSSKSYYDNIIPVSRNIFTTTPPPPIFDMDDEEFLLKQLEDGFNLHNDFKKLLYPRYHFKKNIYSVDKISGKPKIQGNK